MSVEGFTFGGKFIQSVPSPLAGEGQREGDPTACERSEHNNKIQTRNSKLTLRAQLILPQLRREILIRIIDVDRLLRLVHQRLLIVVPAP